MATNIPEGFGLVAVRFDSDHGTGPFIVTGGIELVDGFTLTDMANKIMQAYIDQYVPNMFSVITLTRVSITVDAGDGTLGSVDSTLSPVAGGSSGSAANLSQAVLVNKTSATLGRHGRGRNFWPGLLGQDDINIDGNMEASLQLFYQEMLENLGIALATEADPYPFSITSVLLHSDASLAPSVLTGGTISKKVGILRKRIR